jgi:hypothetical protein
VFGAWAQFISRLLSQTSGSASRLCNDSLIVFLFHQISTPARCPYEQTPAPLLSLRSHTNAPSQAFPSLNRHFPSRHCLISPTMSDSDSARDVRHSPAEITFEGQLALNEIRDTNPLAAAMNTAAWNNDNIDSDESPAEDPSWRLQNFRLNQAAAQLNAQEQEANPLDSDSEPAPQYPPRRLRRHCRCSREHFAWRAGDRTSKRGSYRQPSPHHRNCRSPGRRGHDGRASH